MKTVARLVGGGLKPGVCALTLAAIMFSPQLHAQTAQTAAAPPPLDLDALARGASAFPRIWAPYRPMPLPPPNLANGAQLVQRLASGKLELSLRDFLQLVAENDLDLHASRYDAAIAQVDVLRANSGQAARGTASSPLPSALFAGAIGAGVSSVAGLSGGGTGGAAISTQGKLVTVGPRGVFDPTVSVNLSYDHLVNPLNTSKVAGVSSVIVPSTVLQTRYQQELPYGTSYSISVNLQRQRSTQAGLVFNPALTSFLQIQVYQPLLNGFGLGFTNRFVTIAANDREIVREAFHSTLTNTLQIAANAYWDLIAFRENVSVAQEAVSVAQEQYNEDQVSVRDGTMTDMDLVSAQSQLASTRVLLVGAQMREEQQEVLLKTFMSRADDPRLDAAPFVPTDALPAPSAADLTPVADAVRTALSKRASIRAAELSLTNQHIAEAYTRKNLLPTLSAYAVVDMYGLAPGLTPAVRQLVSWQYPEYSFGFTWSLPVFNRSAQADNIRARFETEQAESALQRTKDQVALDVRTASTLLSQNRAQIGAAERAVENGRVAFAGEQERSRVGISNTYRVMLVQRDLIAAQAADIQARVNYAKALVAHQVAVGEFLDDNGINADEVQRGTLWRPPLLSD